MIHLLVKDAAVERKPLLSIAVEYSSQEYFCTMLSRISSFVCLLETHIVLVILVLW